MSTTVAAMQARLGETNYWVLTLKARELVRLVKSPKEMPGWDELKIEEIYQRDINFNRVRRQIAPYFAEDPNRFCGAIIVAAMNFDVNFEPLVQVSKGVPGMYRKEAEKIGFLHFDGGENLVPLDGQHRLKAIEFAISGRDEKSKPIAGLQQNDALAAEDVTVILVEYEAEKARRIFTRVNKYAKSTTTGQNIITNDDDVVAVLAREVVNQTIGGRLVKFTSNTLRAGDAQFTTIPIIYNCNEEIIRQNFPERPDKNRLASPAQVDLYREKVFEVWGQILEGIDVFRSATQTKEETGDAKRIEMRKASLLGKPVAQECLVKAFVELTRKGTQGAWSAKKASTHLNRVPWNLTEENLEGVWQRVLWTGGTDGKIITKNRPLTVRMIRYLAGQKLPVDDEEKLLAAYRQLFPEGERDDRLLPPVPAENAIN